MSPENLISIGVRSPDRPACSERITITTTLSLPVNFVLEVRKITETLISILSSTWKCYFVINSMTRSPTWEDLEIPPTFTEFEGSLPFLKHTTGPAAPDKCSRHCHILLKTQFNIINTFMYINKIQMSTHKYSFSRRSKKATVHRYKWLPTRT
jgi:hypothetical protein